MSPEESEMSIRSPLGRWLFRTRIGLCLSQAQLAKKAKATKEIIARLENDPDYEPIPAVLVRIAVALNISPTSLLAFLAK